MAETQVCVCTHFGDDHHPDAEDSRCKVIGCDCTQFREQPGPTRTMGITMSVETAISLAVEAAIADRDLSGLAGRIKKHVVDPVVADLESQLDEARQHRANWKARLAEVRDELGKAIGVEVNPAAYLPTLILQLAERWGSAEAEAAHLAQELHTAMAERDIARGERDEARLDVAGTEGERDAADDTLKLIREAFGLGEEGWVPLALREIKRLREGICGDISPTLGGSTTPGVPCVLSFGHASGWHEAEGGRPKWTKAEEPPPSPGPRVWKKGDPE